MSTILLYGQSLWLDGLLVFLEASQSLPVVRADRDDLNGLTKDAVVTIILDRRQESEAVALVRMYPAAAVISIDPIRGDLTVLSGRTATAPTMQEILCVIQSLLLQPYEKPGDRPAKPLIDGTQSSGSSFSPHNT